MITATEGADLTPEQHAANAEAARGASQKKRAPLKAKAPAAPKKAAPRAERVAKPAKAPKEHPVKAAAKAVKKAAAKAADAVAPTPKMRKPRTGKTQTMIDMLNRSQGATMADLGAASGWNQQSIKWFFQATLGKKKGLKVVHEGEGDARVYRIDTPEAV